jgi:hypothetical protein
MKKDLERGVIGQQTQHGVENVFALTPNGNIEEQMQAGVDVKETCAIDVNKIEVELQNTIDMINEQKIVIFIAMSKQENAIGDVKPHVDIDASDILNLIYYN